MTTEADQNYLKETYALEREHGRVTTSMLADRFGVSSASVTGMLKKLAHRHWVSYEPYKGVTLTEEGRLIALEVLRHHRLLETYLVEALGVPWDRVHEEAERLEHALSEYLEARIDELLGHPRFDPHGSPIPAPDGTVRELATLRLSELAEGASAEIVEVSDRDPQLLARLDELGLGLHTRLSVIKVEPMDELMTIDVGGQSLVIGNNTARRVFVKKPS
ncbi:MAG TPA: metal-dependent transcriptional regulator [Rectinemataceae bacterium]|nr:metal-dependent transcriptional regulator [Rectinemataceae bacterium]